VTSSALFSSDRRYRYWLLRTWDLEKPRVAFVGLNPSTADEREDDPTIRRCIGFAKLWGYGGLLMLNMYAFRSTKPGKMWEKHRNGGDIVGGKQNYVEAMQNYIAEFDVEQVIAAWGSDKLTRHVTFKTASWKLDCLKINDDGQPGHPLYLPYMAERQPWNY
jgi:hypothetical protein